MASGSARSCVLLADDEPQLLSLIERVLGRAGYEVVSAANGDEAVRRFSDEPGRIGVVVLDAAIAPGGAAPVLEELVKTSEPLGVVFTSGDILAEAERELLDRHEGVFLRKPFPPSALLRAVEDSLVKGSA